MEDQIQKILNELFELDPKLKTEEVLVRKLVLEMLESRPAILPDAALKAAVRARLMATLATSQTETKSGFVLPWWLVYTAPVSVATLLFMLTTPGNGPIVLAPQGPAPVEVMSPMSEPAVSAKVSPEMDAVVPVRGMAMPADMGGEMMAESPKVQGFTDTALSVGRLVPGETVFIEWGWLTAPAFIVIRDLETETIMGVSELQAIGEVPNLTLPLTTPTKVGVDYEAVIYFDNGDGVFDEATDVFDSSITFWADL